MGELVAGVGDEVLLFATFLILSACFYVVVLLYKRHRSRQNTEQAAQQADEEVHDEAPEALTPPSGPTHTQHSSSSTLRSRFHTSTGAGSPQSVQSDTQSSSSQPADDGMISVRLIKPDQTTTVRVAPTTTLQELRNSNFREEITQHRPVSFILHGRVLTDNSATLLSLGVTNGRALHVHIGRPRPQGEAPDNQPAEELDLSQLFVPLFGIILGMIWISLLMYPAVFNLITKFFVFVLSLGYVLLTYVNTFG